MANALRTERSLFPLEEQSVPVNVASVPQRSPFRYPGGKTWLTPIIRRWFAATDRPDHFVDVFGGGGSVALTVALENLADRTTLVELDEDVAAVWKAILSTRWRDLTSLISSFQMTRESVDSVLGASPRSTAARAFRTILKNRVQHGGILAPGARMMNAGENGRGLASRWYPQTLCRRIAAIADVRARIEFIHGDGVRVLERLSLQPRTRFFVDPPYTIAGRRLYALNAVDHPRLFDLCASLAGDYLMTYDDSPLVERWAAARNMDTRRVPMKSRQHAIKQELLIGRDLAWTGAAPTRRAIA